MLFRMLFDNVLTRASYLIGDQRIREALAIDPERDMDIWIAISKWFNSSAITKPVCKRVGR